MTTWEPEHRGGSLRSRTNYIVRVEIMEGCAEEILHGVVDAMDDRLYDLRLAPGS
jgi:hypothetical protein